MKKPKRKPPARFTIAEIAEAWDSRPSMVAEWSISTAAQGTEVQLKRIARRRARKGKRK